MAVAVESPASGLVDASAAELAELERLLHAPAALDHVTVDLAGRRVLNDVTFPIERGKINVIIGPSGVGKTTIIRALIGLQQPTYGRVLTEGRDLKRLGRKEEKAFRDDLSVMIQGNLSNLGMFGSLNAFDNVAFALRQRKQISEEEIVQRCWRYISEVGMTSRGMADILELSGGETRRIALARTLACESGLVVIDDVESGVDHVRLRGMIDLIARKQLEQKNTYLITTNEPEVARRLADNLIVIRAGHVVEHGPATEILRAQDAFGRRLMAGDAASGLAMLDEVGPSEHERAKGRSTDYNVRQGMLMMATCLITTLIWSLQAFTTG